MGFVDSAGCQPDITVMQPTLVQDKTTTHTGTSWHVGIKNHEEKTKITGTNICSTELI